MPIERGPRTLTEDARADAEQRAADRHSVLFEKLDIIQRAARATDQHINAKLDALDERATMRHAAMVEMFGAAREAIRLGVEELIARTDHPAGLAMEKARLEVEVGTLQHKLGVLRTILEDTNESPTEAEQG